MNFSQFCLHIFYRAVLMNLYLHNDNVEKSDNRQLIIVAYCVNKRWSDEGKDYTLKRTQEKITLLLP